MSLFTECILPNQMNERRRRMRFALCIPCRFWCYSEASGPLFGTGSTVDLSSDGIRISTSQLPPGGAFITIEADLPGAPGSALEAGWEEYSGKRGQGFEPLSGEGRVTWQNLMAKQFAAQICYGPLFPVVSEHVSSPSKRRGEEPI